MNSTNHECMTETEKIKHLNGTCLWGSYRIGIFVFTNTFASNCLLRNTLHISITPRALRITVFFCCFVCVCVCLFVFIWRIPWLSMRLLTLRFWQKSEKSVRTRDPCNLAKMEKSFLGLVVMKWKHCRICTSQRTRKKSGIIENINKFLWISFLVQQQIVKVNLSVLVHSYVNFLRSKQSTCEPGSKMEVAIKYILKCDKQKAAAARRTPAKRKRVQNIRGPTKNNKKAKKWGYHLLYRFKAPWHKIGICHIGL